MPPDDPQEVKLTMDDPVAEVDEDDIPPELEFDELVAEDIGADGDDGFEAAAAQAPVLEIVSEDATDLEMEMRDFGELITDNDFIEATAENMSALAVKGSVGNSVKAASGAVD